MDQSPIEHARDLMRVGDLEKAGEPAESEIARIGPDGDAARMWDFRFICARVLEARGRAEEALSYLESFVSPTANEVESAAAFKMYCGEYSGYLGRYEASHRLFEASEALARGAGLLELLGEIHLSGAFIFFRQKDYVTSDALFRAALELSE